MQRILLALVLCVSSQIIPCEAVWNNGPSQLLREIFNFLALEGVENIETAREVAKKHLMRPKDKERWEVYKTVSDTQKEQLRPLLFDSVMVKRVLPSRTDYDAAAVFGATITRVNNRLEYLCKLLENGLKVQTIYLLGSDRDLRAGSLDDQSYAIKLVNRGIEPSEMQMMICLWEDLKQKYSQLKDMRVILIKANKKPNGKRAGTIDNLEAMTKLTPDLKGKHILFVSNNPYVAYQDSVCKRVLHKTEAIFETVGDAASTNETVENILDSIAMTLDNVAETF